MQAAALLRLLKDEMEHEENDESAEKSKDENDVVNGASEDVETIQKSSDDPTTMETNRINEYAKTQTNGTEAQMNEEDVLKDRPELTEVFRGITLMRRVLASEESQGGDESRDIDDIHPGCLPTPSGINTAATFDRDLPSAAEESTIPMAVGHMEQEQSNEAAKNTTPAISEAPSRSSDDAESRREVHGKMLESQLVFEDFISTYLENQFGKSSQQLLSDVFDFYPLQFGPGRPRTATVPIGMYDEEEEAQDSGVELDDVAYIRS
ncbi:hypothetical protein MPER_09168 [Moniliophthora perniciosa FA553]|nr:hypothetical protein MPER_09168 [Moniliophthora perniciosa FA553]